MNAESVKQGPTPLDLIAALGRSVLVECANCGRPLGRYHGVWLFDAKTGEPQGPSILHRPKRARKGPRTSPGLHPENIDDGRDVLSRRCPCGQERHVEADRVRELPYATRDGQLVIHF